MGGGDAAPPLSEQEIRRRQGDQPLQLDLEVGVFVAVDVALDDCLVGGGAGEVLLESVELALRAGEYGALRGEETERGTAGGRSVRVDCPEVDVIDEMLEINDLVA